MNLDKIKFPINNYEKLINDISGLKLDEPSCKPGAKNIGDCKGNAV